jgi:hypothetical protein
MHPTRDQVRRLVDVAAFRRPPLGRLAAGRQWDPWAKQIPEAARLVPAEGFLPHGGEGRWDPLGIARMRHDVAVLDPRSGRTAFDAVVEEQAAPLRAAMAFDPDQVLDQAEQVDTPEGPLRIVNKVCSVTARPLCDDEMALDEDDESEYEVNTKMGAPLISHLGRVGAEGLDYGDDDDDDDDGDGNAEDAASVTDDDAPEEMKKKKKNQKKRRKKKKKKAAMPSIMSLRSVQRRWLPLGYKKNKVGTALSIRYAPPLTSTHMAFTTDRLLCMGANNRRNDRAGVVYATLPYLFRPLSDLSLKPRRYGAFALSTFLLPYHTLCLGVLRRVSQNIVARQSMPHGRKMCLVLFHSRLSTEASKKPPRRFKNIIVAHHPMRTTFLFYRDNKICVGASSFENMARAYAYFRPLVNDCLNTPENEAAELNLIRQGAADEDVTRVLLNYAVREDGQIEAVYKGDKPVKKK